MSTDPAVPVVLARLLSGGVLFVMGVCFAGAASLWQSDSASTATAHAAVELTHEIPPAPPARIPGGLDFRPMSVDLDPDKRQANTRARVRNGQPRERYKSAPPGVLLVSIDGLRPDYATPYGAAASATPTLAELAKVSTVFTRSYSQANETLFSHASLFTSNIPSHLGDVNYDLTIRSGQPTLAKAMGYAGYRTAAMVGGGHLARVFGLDDGFQEYVEGQRWGSFQETVPLAVNWLEDAAKGEQPYFLFVHGYDVHMPYTKPSVFGRSATPGYDGMLLERADDSLLYERIYKGTLYPDFPLSQVATHTGTKILAPEVRDQLAAWAKRPDAGGLPLDEKDVAFVKGLYATSAFYADSWLGVLFQEIRRLGLWDNLTVVVISDHGEGLMSHEFVNHRSSLEDASTNCVLMIHRPGGHAARVDDVVELLDVGPTILDLAGADIPETFQGTSLFPCLERGRCPGDGIAYSEGIMRQVSMTNGIRRLTLDGYPAASADIDTELRTASWKDEHLTYEDVRGPPGSETPTPPDGLFTELAQGGLKRRSR